MWIIFSLLTALCWGIFAVMLKRSYVSLTPVMSVILGACAAILILLPFALLNEAKFVFWPLVPISVLIAGCYAFFSYALDKGKASLVSTVQSTYPLFTVILAAIFLKEPTSNLIKIGILIIVAGLILLSIESPKQLKSIKLGSWFFWGLSAAAIAGSGDFISKIMINHFNPYTFMMGFVIGEVIFALIISLIDRRNLRPLSTGKDTLYLIAGCVALYFGYLFFYLALAQGFASLVVPITGLYGVITLSLAVIWLKERISKLQLIGAVLAIFGAIIVGSM